MASIPYPDTKPPALPALLREAGSMVAFRWKRMMPVNIAARGRGRGEPVLVIPGFLATDSSTQLLRRTLDHAGYRAYGWKQGVNLGAKLDLFDRLEARLEKAARRGPVTLIGWSLGGLYARELAKRQPDKVAKVITLGSPFSGDIRANHAWWLYEMLNDHKVDAPPVEVSVGEKPPVPTIAFWSRQDGIVAPACARGEPHQCDESVEVDCTHMGFMTCPRTMRALLDKIAS